MNTTEALMTTDQQCIECQYNLIGLPMNGKCPECGTPIKRKNSRTSGKMADEAPQSFVSLLRVGFLIAAIGIIGSVFLWTSSLLFFSTVLWVLGVYIITTPRPNRGTILPDKVLDNDNMRLVVRGLSAAWVVYALLALGVSYMTITPAAAQQGATPSMLEIPLRILAGLVGIIAWVGIIPTCVYFAELSYWSSHDYIANRLRSCAWTMTVCGIIAVVFGGIAQLGFLFSSPAALVSAAMWLLVTLAVIVFLFTNFQLISVLGWVKKNQLMAEGSKERVRERIEKEIKSPGQIVTGLYCRKCKYDLDGLPHGGKCPECGLSYADITPMPILDPAKMYTTETEPEIELSEGDHKGIYFNSEIDAFGKPKPSAQSYTPDPDAIPDEGDIPLSEPHNSLDGPQDDGSIGLEPA